MTTEDETRTSGVAEFARTYGFDPVLAMAMFAIKEMLFFFLELPSMELLAGVSCVVGLLLIVPGALLQRYVYGDTWGAAWAKAIVAGILVGIPTPLPGAIIACGGVLGVIGRSARHSRQQPPHLPGGPVGR